MTTLTARRRSHRSAKRVTDVQCRDDVRWDCSAVAYGKEVLLQLTLAGAGLGRIGALVRVHIIGRDGDERVSAHHCWRRGGARAIVKSGFEEARDSAVR